MTSTGRPLGGLLPPPEPPRLIERLRNETTEASQVTGSEIYFYFAQSHLIGQGASSWVFRGYHHVPDKKSAVKCITCKDEKEVIKNTNELCVWRQIAGDKHPGARNIIEFYECGREVNILYVCMEMAECSLEQELQFNVEPFKDRHQIVGYLRNIAAGLECLHNHNIVHRDIKPQNIFIVQDSSGKRVAKLGDFGLCRVLSQSQGSLSFGQGTKMWMAPEVLKALDEEELFLNTKAMDVFSFGMVASYCLRGRGHPFQQNDKLTVNIKDDKVTPKDLGVPKHAAADNLLLWMMQKKPERRPTIQQCRAHPFLWEEETSLEFFKDVLECLLWNKEPDYLEDSAVIRASLDVTYKTYFECRYKTVKFNWTDEVDSRLLEGDLKEYDGRSMMSYLEFATDKQLQENGVLKELFAEDGVFSRVKFARYFLDKYPKMVIILFCTLTAVEPVFPCLGKLQEKYFKNFVGCQDNWTDEIVFKCLEIFLGEIQTRNKLLE